MKDSLATAISDITQMLKSQDIAQQSPDKFRELLDYKKILFVAHREEILNQAETSFKAVSRRHAGF